MEGEIILNILSQIEAGTISLFSSEISIYEAEKISNTFRREFTLKVLSERIEFTQLNDEIENRSRVFTKFGIKPIDALHLASAEVLKADFFCTCDDKFLKKAKGIDDLRVRAVSILELLQEMEK